MEKAKDFYSKNVADAIRQACAEFATSQEKLDIEVVETGSAGIFGLCRKRAHIRVTLKRGEQEVKEPVKKAKKGKAEPATEVETPAQNVEQEEMKKAPKKRGAGKGGGKGKQKTGKTEKPVQSQEPIEPPSPEALAALQTDLDKVLQLMGFPSEVQIAFAEGAIQCQINGDHVDSIAGPDGRTLDSMQYLLRKMYSQDLPDRMMIDLNAGDFRERRVEELQQKAVELADKVKSDGKTQAIPALNPSERRVVHVTLQDDKAVRSRSVGDGLFKKVLIYKPGTKARKSGGRRRGRQGGRTTSE